MAANDDLDIVDSQLHIWAAETPDRPWPPHLSWNTHGPDHITAKSVIERMDAAGVNAAVLVPPSFEGDRNDFCLEAANTYPGRFKVFGRFPLDAAGIERVIQDGMKDEDLLGIRVTFNSLTANWLVDGTLEWFWPFAEKNNVPVSLWCPGQMRELGEVALRFPRLKLSVDHLGLKEGLSLEDVRRLVGELEQLGKRPNVGLKVSGLACSMGSNYNVKNVRELTDQLLDWFEPERLFWGSDMTRCVPNTYRESIDIFLDAVAAKPRHVVELMMGQSLRNWIGWPRGQ